MFVKPSECNVSLKSQCDTPGRVPPDSQASPGDCDFKGNLIRAHSHLFQSVRNGFGQTGKGEPESKF